MRSKVCKKQFQKVCSREPGTIPVAIGEKSAVNGFSGSVWVQVLRGCDFQSAGRFGSCSQRKARRDQEHASSAGGVEIKR